MSVEPLSDEEIRTALTDQPLPGMVDNDAPTPAPTAFLQAVFLRKPCQSEVDHTDETANTLLSGENVAPQSLTATTSTTKTLSGSGDSTGTHNRPSISTDLTSVLSPGFLDKKCVEEDHAQLQEGPCSSTSMRATNGSNTSTNSESDKLIKKKEPLEWEWNTIGVGSQFSSSGRQSPPKRVRSRTRVREVIVHHDLEESVRVALAIVEIQQQNAELKSQVLDMDSKVAEIELRMKSDTRHLYLLISLLVTVVFIGGVIAWKI